MMGMNESEAELSAIEEYQNDIELEKLVKDNTTLGMNEDEARLLALENYYGCGSAEFTSALDEYKGDYISQSERDEINAEVLSNL